MWQVTPKKIVFKEEEEKLFSCASESVLSTFYVLLYGFVKRKWLGKNW